MILLVRFTLIDPWQFSTNTHLHQAWANTYVRLNEHVAIGLEWQDGGRLTFGEGNGENHRIFFGVELTCLVLCGRFADKEFGDSRPACRVRDSRGLLSHG